MDVRIGVTQAPRELSFDLSDDDSDSVERIEALLAGDDDSGVLWLTDKRGRRIAVPVAKIAYVEIGTPDSDRRVGFGG